MEKKLKASLHLIYHISLPDEERNAFLIPAVQQAELIQNVVVCLP